MTRVSAWSELSSLPPEWEALLWTTYPAPRPGFRRFRMTETGNHLRTPLKLVSLQNQVVSLPAGRAGELLDRRLVVLGPPEPGVQPFVAHATKGCTPRFHGAASFSLSIFATAGSSLSNWEYLWLAAAVWPAPGPKGGRWGRSGWTPAEHYPPPTQR